MKNRATLSLSKSACIANVEKIRDTLRPQTKVMAVVKANAYGCGVGLVAPVLKQAGVDYFAVATTDEARELAKTDPETPILLLSEPLAQELDLLPHNIELTVYSQALIEVLTQMAPKRQWKLHLKLNTGLNRLGAEESMFWELWQRIEEAQNLTIVGVMTHLIESEQRQSTRTPEQLAQFSNVVSLAKTKKPTIIAHTANSAALKLGGELEFDMVRVGLALYQDALSLKTLVLHTQSLNTGDSASYQQLFIAQKPCQIAILAMGYADGIPTITQNATVMINDKIYPIVGRICMDMVCVNLGDDHCEPGDEAILFDPTQEKAPSYESWLLATRQNPREFFCGLGPRVKRVTL